LCPGGPPLLEWQRFEDVRDVGRVHSPQVSLKLGQVLSSLKVFDQLSTRTLVALRECLEHSMPLEQPHDGLEALLEVRLWPDDRHVTMLSRRRNIAGRGVFTTVLDDGSSRRFFATVPRWFFTKVLNKAFANHREEPVKNPREEPPWSTVVENPRGEPP
jgi:hypothetical protein